MKSILKDLPQTPLTPEREQELLVAGDTETIVLHALLPAIRYVHYTSRFQAPAESLSLCYAALSKAIKNFRPNRGKFISYAIPYLRGEVCAEWRRKDAVRGSSMNETPTDDVFPKFAEGVTDPAWGEIHWRETWEQVEPLIREHLTALEIRVLEFRYKHNLTLQETGEIIHKSRERVRQIEAKALKKLRGALSSQDKLHTI